MGKTLTVNEGLAGIMEDGSYATRAAQYSDFDITPPHARKGSVAKLWQVSGKRVRSA
ncbi:hypothetical protein RAH32_15830 [Paracoccus sp. WLY502]|uniref:hypothetical protein n=1 Tax=Paracoccus yibinensis TaxID=3068891 RepID=UPI0027967EE3|nr:hypothetical protein [Paracoccus sp. WLY502]MDQ1901911.1 hypothetical protein [Paracoccus sp. WLY502]